MSRHRGQDETCTEARGWAGDGAEVAHGSSRLVVLPHTTPRSIDPGDRCPICRRRFGDGACTMVDDLRVGARATNPVGARVGESLALCFYPPPLAIFSALRSWCGQHGYWYAAALLRRRTRCPPPPLAVGASPLWLLVSDAEREEASDGPMAGPILVGGSRWRLQTTPGLQDVVTALRVGHPASAAGVAEVAVLLDRELWEPV